MINCLNLPPGKREKALLKFLEGLDVKRSPRDGLLELTESQLKGIIIQYFLEMGDRVFNLARRSKNGGVSTRSVDIPLTGAMIAQFVDMDRSSITRARKDVYRLRD